MSDVENRRVRAGARSGDLASGVVGGTSATRGAGSSNVRHPAVGARVVTEAKGA